MNRVIIAGILLLGFSLPSSGDDTRQQIQLKSVGTNTYYIDSHIEGWGDVPLLVDTGSGYSTINNATLTQLKSTGDAIYLKQLEGILADGTRMIVPVYRISSVNLAGKCTIRNIEVAVFPSGTRQILGLNALSKVSPFTFSMNPPSITLSNCENTSA